MERPTTSEQTGWETIGINLVSNSEQELAELIARALLQQAEEEEKEK